MGALQFTPAQVDDAGWVADLLTAADSENPADPEMLRHAWLSSDPTVFRERLLVLAGSARIGFTSLSHPDRESTPGLFGFLRAELLAGVAGPGHHHEVFEVMEERARGRAIEVVVCMAREHDEARLRLLADRGYREESRERFWELDLAANRDRLQAMAVATRVKMKELGVELLTLAADSDPERYQKLHLLSEEGEEDIPSSVPHQPEPFEVFMKLLESPALREDRIWIARWEEDVVATSFLAYPPRRGHVTTDWTTTARRVRGRGIARAVKLESLLQAIELGVERVRTDNHARNGPMIHINEELGYHEVPGTVEFHKRLSNKPPASAARSG